MMQIRLTIMFLALFAMVIGCHKTTKTTEENIKETNTDTTFEISTDVSITDAKSSETEAPPATDTDGGQTIDGEVSESVYKEERKPTDASLDSEQNTAEKLSKDTQMLFDPGITWVTIEPGTFWMGSPENAWGHQANERHHPVTLTHYFEMAATEITIGQWESLGFDLPSRLQGDDCIENDCPVRDTYKQGVFNWLDALSREMGYSPCYDSESVFQSPYHCEGYRLPTEAEWEYAARAGTETATYSGDPDPDSPQTIIDPIAQCNKGGNLIPVAEKRPNPWGLFDMLGNLSEYTTWIGIYAEGESVNPFAANEGETWLSPRGGSANSYGYDNCRAADRGGAPGGYDNANTGYNIALRPVRTLPGSVLPNPTDKDDSCPETANYSCPGYGEDADTLIVGTDLLGNEATFAAMAQHMEAWEVLGILATRSNTAIEETVLLAYSLFPDHEYTVNPLVNQVEALNPIALSYRLDTESFVALLCGTTCFLAETQATHDHEADFVALVGGTVPEEITPRAMAAGVDRTVVVGDGIAVHKNGEWQIPIAPGSAPIFNAVDVYARGDTDYFVAVGDNGRIALGYTNEWTELDSGITDNLFDVSISKPSLVIISGENGQMVTIEMEDVTSCIVSKADFTQVIVNTGQGDDRDEIDIRLLTETGDQIYYPRKRESTPLCITDPASADTIQTETVQCGIAFSTLYLSPNGLYGDFMCAID